jgi:hypothetical protein
MLRTHWFVMLEKPSNLDARGEQVDCVNSESTAESSRK